MISHIGQAAPDLEAEAFVRGSRTRKLGLRDLRGTWVVVAFGALRADILELSALDEAFAADGAVVLAATPDETYQVEYRYADESVRIPILTEVAEQRRINAIVDPDGIVRHVGLRRSARETLARLESLLLPGALAA
jgi:peroxiredoxin